MIPVDEFLFQDFLCKPDVYDQAVRFWQHEWQDLISRLGQDAMWQTPWIGTTFANGTPCRDGNPIFSAVSDSRGLGVRVIQVAPGDNPREFDFWTDMVGEGPDAIRELVVACVLTASNLARVKDLATQWMLSGNTEIQPGSFTPTAPEGTVADVRNEA